MYLFCSEMLFSFKNNFLSVLGVVGGGVKESFVVNDNWDLAISAEQLSPSLDELYCHQNTAIAVGV